MGLDTLASRGPVEFLTEDDVAAFRAADVQLCECDGDTSFRGKLYVSLVLEATGEPLPYEGMWTEPAIVQRMADRLEHAEPAEVAERTGDPIDEVTRDLQELARFFRVCADRGLGLLGG